MCHIQLMAPFTGRKERTSQKTRMFVLGADQQSTRGFCHYLGPVVTVVAELAMGRQKLVKNCFFHLVPKPGSQSGSQTCLLRLTTLMCIVNSCVLLISSLVSFHEQWLALRPEPIWASGFQDVAHVDKKKKKSRTPKASILKQISWESVTLWRLKPWQKGTLFPVSAWQAEFCMLWLAQYHAEDVK